MIQVQAGYFANFPNVVHWTKTYCLHFIIHKLKNSLKLSWWRNTEKTQRWKKSFLCFQTFYFLFFLWFLLMFPCILAFGVFGERCEREVRNPLWDRVGRVLLRGRRKTCKHTPDGLLACVCDRLRGISRAGSSRRARFHGPECLRGGSTRAPLRPRP